MSPATRTVTGLQRPLRANTPLTLVLPLSLVTCSGSPRQETVDPGVKPGQQASCNGTGQRPTQTRKGLGLLPGTRSQSRCPNAWSPLAAPAQINPQTEDLNNRARSLSIESLHEFDGWKTEIISSFPSGIRR